MEQNIKTPFLVTAIFYTLGVCIMLPWNFFITCNSYWQYKLRNATQTADYGEATDDDLTQLQVAFTPTLVIISNVTVVIFGFITSAITRRVGERIRIFGSLGICLGAMALVLILSTVNTDEWQQVFFGVTMVTIALINVGVSILQASCYGMAGRFPSRCMTALVSGQALAGVLSSFSQIISLAIGAENPVSSAHIYFSIACGFIIFTFISYSFLIKAHHYQQTSNDESVLERKTKKPVTNFKEYTSILQKVKWMGFSLGLSLMTTLSVYPAVQVYVTSIHPGSSWADVYFQPTITFLLFNIMDMAGRETPRLFKWPSHRGWQFHLLVASRLVFLPLILLCNGQNKSFATLFYHDATYAVINSLFAFSGGYLGSLALVYYPRFVTHEETELAGTLMAALMGVGMISGSCLSIGFVAAWGPQK